MSDEVVVGYVGGDRGALVAGAADLDSAQTFEAELVHLVVDEGAGPAGRALLFLLERVEAGSAEDGGLTLLALIGIVDQSQTDDALEVLVVGGNLLYHIFDTDVIRCFYKVRDCLGYKFPS